jgi:thiamine biosynthesis lipoprotein
MQSLQFRAMNTDILLAVEGQEGPDASQQLLVQARSRIQDFEQRFSRFLPDSELSRLNVSAGRWAEVSDDLLDLLVLARAYYLETGGLFDPSVLSDLKRVGYDASLEIVQQRGDAPDAHPRQERAPFSDIEIDTTRQQVKLPQGMEIDLGGIGKGWIVQQVAQQLRAETSAAAVSAGGDIFFAGLPADGQRWRVEIEDPRAPDHTMAVLKVGEGAVVTSSVSKRTWSQGGQRRHHIIDPRSGEPAQAHWLSVTVIAPRADLAEAYAKALLIGGQQEARRLTTQRPQIAVISIGADGRLLASQKAKEYVNDGSQLIS